MKYGWIIIALLVVLGGGFYILERTGIVRWAPAPVVPCTTDLQLCTDGSYVGRQGPKCEFTQCPPDPPRPPMATSSAHIIGRIGQVSSVLGIMITPLEILEDSRCPSGVQCIQAGTVRVRLKIENGTNAAEQIITLGKSVSTDTTKITLTDVAPAKSPQPILLTSYLFSFTVEKL